MPPRGKPTSSHSSRPSRPSRPSSSHSSRSSRPSSSHSSRSSHSSHSSHSSWSSRPSRPSPPPPPRPPVYRPPHHSRGNFSSGGYGGPPPPPDYGYHRPPRYQRSFSRRDSFGCARASGCIGALAIIALVISVVFAVQYIREKDLIGQSPDASVGTESHQPVYVSALGRDVPWSAQYDSYYDAQTDCYFFLNTDVDPAVWQYWFEGISSQYGDYGWLEWDAKESRWYVQTGAEKWELLPEKSASDLWHFD